jgi:hypothetical protein
MEEKDQSDARVAAADMRGEARVRYMRAFVFGVYTTDENWLCVRDQWLEASGREWLEEKFAAGPLFWPKGRAA